MANKKKEALNKNAAEHLDPAAVDAIAEALASGEDSMEPVEAVETVEVPNGRRVAGNDRNASHEQEPANDEQNHPAQRTSRERKRSLEEHQAARMQRQEDALIVGKYLSAEKRNNVLSGKIAGVEVRGDHAFWIIYDGPVIIMIPFKDALPYLETSAEKLTRVEKVRQVQLLSKSVGAVVPFTVEKMEGDPESGTYVVFGSRSNALERIRGRFFGKNAAKPVKEGDIVVGVFLAVGAHAAWLNVNGVDVRLVPMQLSHRFMEDMQTVYKPGDEISLRVQKLELKNGELHNIVLSALPCELEACKARLGRVRSGNRYVATITSHRVMNTVNPRTKEKELYYVSSMWLEGVDVPAYATVTSSHVQGTAHSGDRVAVQVEKIAQNGYVCVRIISYLPR